MSWQDELHQLDADLAGGRLSADEYRLRRDQLLVRASGQAASAAAPPPAPQAPPPPQPPQAPAQQFTAPPVNPFPPAFSWQRDGRDSKEATQVMRPVPGPGTGQPNGPDNVDRTQVVAGNDAERTQVVPAVRAPVPPAEGPWSSQPPPGGGPAPWSGPDAPAGFGTPSWLLQGPEVFREPRGNRSRIVVIGIAVLVVLLVGAGVYFFAIRPQGGSSSAQQGRQTAPTTTHAKPTPTGPKLPTGPFVSFPGTSVNPQGGQNVTIDAAVKAEVPTPVEGPLLKTAGVTDIGFLVTADGQISRGLWVFTPGQGTDPGTVLSKINQEFADAGYQQLPDAPAGVTALTLPSGPQQPGGVFRAHYITQGKVVRVEAYGPDADAARRAFDSLLKKELTAFPATQ